MTAPICGSTWASTDATVTGDSHTPARSGQQYVESLRKSPPCVYRDGRRVAVTAEPIFQEPIRAIAEQYDMQLDPAYRDIMTDASPTTGAPVSTSFLVPRTRAERDGFISQHPARHRVLATKR